MITIAKKVLHKPTKVEKIDGKAILKHDTILFTGQYKGYKVSEVLDKDPSYLIGLSQGKFFEVDKEILNSAYCILGWLTFK